MTQSQSAADVEAVKAKLSANEKRVLLALGDAGGSADPDALVERGAFRVVQEVTSAASWLADKGLLEIEETTETLVGLDDEGKHHAAEGLPERRVQRYLEGLKDGTATLGEITNAGVLSGGEVPIALGWLKRKGWAAITKAEGNTLLSLTDAGRAAAPGADELALGVLTKGDVMREELDEKGYADLKGRKGITRERERTHRRLVLTPSGAAVVASGLELKAEIVQLTPELLATGKWRDTDIRPYDVTAFAPRAIGGKPHPLNVLIQEIREVFVEMGFAEIDGDYVESAFWNMDVLFIPQDHPAREMQDTFYLSNPATLPLDGELVDRVADVHEGGGGTGSTGWGGRFSRQTSAKGLLRTHTTVGTIRYLFENPDAPCRVFSIGRVFRNETMDATHLPEFHQIEGIIKQPGANFRMLVGTLREFYRRMGFSEVRVRPAYFPYTEPSMEIEVFYNGRWMELGGSGILRPEVTQPLGVADPVCAWGLGLERLAMMRFGLKDIRDIYVSDVDWLRRAPVRQV